MNKFLLYMLVGDGIFSYALESMKTLSKFPLAFELSLRFADPSPYYGSVLLLAGILCGLMAWITDSYIGQFLATLIGLFFATLTAIIMALGICIHENVLHKSGFIVAANIILIFYIITSPSRNNIILNQIKIPEEKESVRLYIFILVYVRLVGRVIFIFLLFSTNDNPIFLKVSAFVSLIVCIGYFLFIFKSEPYIHFEPLYLRLWENTIKYILFVLKNRKTKKQQSEETDATVSKPQIEKEVSETVNFVEIEKQPHRVLRSWGFRGIVKKHYIPPDEEVGEEDEVVEEKEKSFLESIFGRIHSDSMKSADSEVDNDDDKIVMYNREHWFFRSYPDMSVFVVEQTLRLVDILLLLTTGFVYGLILYYIISISLMQMQLCKTVRPTANSQIKEPTTYSLMFDLLLLPMIEFAVVPLIRKIFRKDFVCIILGYLSLILSGVIMFGMHVSFETNLQYVPQSWRGNVRFVNALPSKIYLTGNWLEETIINPDDYIFMEDIFLSHSPKKAPFRYIDLISKEFYDADAVLYEKSTVSYVISFGGLKQVNNSDPTAFSHPNTRNDSLSHYYVVTGLNLKDSKIFFLVKHSKKKISQPIDLDRNAKSVPPGDYQIVIEIDNQLINISHGINMLPGAMYALFIFGGSEKSPVPFYSGEMLLTEGPVTVRYESLLVQIFFASFAYSLANVSFFRFLYLESPSKLRSSILSLIIAFNFIEIGCNSIPGFKIVPIKSNSPRIACAILVTVVSFIATFILSKRFPFKYQ